MSMASPEAVTNPSQTDLPMHQRARQYLSQRYRSLIINIKPEGINV